jgi:hypothetical protein
MALKSPCEYPDLPAVAQALLNHYCGFRPDFTKHDWCARHWIGVMLRDGTIKRCPCDCHRSREQLCLIGLHR